MKNVSVLFVGIIVVLSACNPAIPEENDTVIQTAIAQTQEGEDLIQTLVAQTVVASIPTVTITPTETLIPSPTITPAPVLPRIETSAQTNGTTLVTDRVCGFQFTLPAGWRVADPFAKYQVWAKYARNTDDFLRPDLTMGLYTRPRELDLELELYKFTADEVGTFDSVLSQAVTASGSGVKLGTLKAKYWVSGMLHPTYYEMYDILFLCDDEVIHLWFFGKRDRNDQFSSTEMQSIRLIQNSIQFK